MSAPNVFAEELRELIRARGLTEKDAAALAGLSQQFVNDLARGRRGQRPTPTTIFRLARALEVEPEYFTLWRHRILVEQYPDVLDAVYSRVVAGVAP